MIRLSRRPAGLAALMLAGALTWPASAAAAVTTLRSALLPAAAVPSIFAHPHVKVYHRFSATLQVRTTVAGMAGNSTCTLPTSLAGDGWTQGMIEAFDRSSTTSALQLCGALFHTTHGAHLAYQQLVQAHFQPLLTAKYAVHLATPRIGNEVSGINRTGVGCACAPKDVPHSYEIVFRHDNAVLDLAFSGPVTVSPAQFVRLVTRTNAELH
jgi:hypothetical protein